jgi:hypothetical protein
VPLKFRISCNANKNCSHMSEFFERCISPKDNQSLIHRTCMRVFKSPPWVTLSNILIQFKVARYSYHKNHAQESRTQNRGTIFTRRSRKLINKMKRTSKMTWREHLLAPYQAPLRVFYSVLCQLLTSLEFSILEKQCALSLYFVWWPMFKCCMLYCIAKNFHYTKKLKNL